MTPLAFLTLAMMGGWIVLALYFSLLLRDRARALDAWADRLQLLSGVLCDELESWNDEQIARLCVSHPELVNAGATAADGADTRRA